MKSPFDLLTSIQQDSNVLADWYEENGLLYESKLLRSGAMVRQEGTAIIPLVLLFHAKQSDYDQFGWFSWQEGILARIYCERRSRPVVYWMNAEIEEGTVDCRRVYEIPKSIIIGEIKFVKDDAKHLLESLIDQVVQTRKNCRKRK